MPDGLNGEFRRLRLAVILQTPKDPQSAVYIGYDSLRSALETLGHAVVIVAPGDFRLLRAISGRWVPLIYPVVIAAWLWRNRARFDLVVFHSYAGWLCRDSRRNRWPPAIVAFHGLEPLYHRELAAEATAEGHPLSWRYRLLQERIMPVMLRTGCRKAVAVTCLNRKEAEFLSARGWVSARDLHVTPHGIPGLFFAGRHAVAGSRTWLFVGQWLPMKGIRYLRDAMATLLARDQDMRLVCAGTLADEAAVLADFPEPLRSRIAVHPRVDQHVLAELYARADGFVFPSLYEGFSRAIVEAMAAGLPIVTTNAGVAADALRDEVSALIVPARDASAIVTAVERLRADPGLAARLGAAAADSATSYHMEDRQHEMIPLLLRIAAGHS